MATLDDVLAEVKALREEQARTLRGVALLVKHLGAAPQAAAGASSSAPAIAPDSELDSQYGNPEIKKDPKRWKGNPLAPCRMGDDNVSPDYLDCFAEFKDWQASQEEGKGDDEAKKKAGYMRKDAARARGWAARKRKQGWTDRSVGQEPPPDQSPPDDGGFV